MKKLLGIVICLSLLTSLIAGAVACASEEKTVTATIKTVDGKEKTVTFNGQIVRITDATEITLDGEKASLKDLTYGMQIVVTHKGVKAIKVEAKAKAAK